MQKKQVIQAIAGGLGVLFFIIAFSWFWSLGAVEPESPSEARVEAVTQPVEWRRRTDEVWKTMDGTVSLLDGDRIRTGKGGQAIIRWGNQGLTRLESETELDIEQSQITPDSAFVVRIKLESGRVWSRLLKIFDVGGTLQVKTSDTVATVRGTAFGIIKGRQTEAVVNDSVIEIGGRFLKEGEWGSFSSSGTPSVVRKLAQADAWAETNRLADSEFERELLADLELQLRARVKKFESKPVWLLRLSEELHLVTLADDKKRALAAAYANRHASLAVTGPNNSSADRKAAIRFASLAGTHVRQALLPVHSLASLEPAGQRRDLMRGLRAELIGQVPAATWVMNAVRLNETIDDFIALEEPPEIEARALLRDLALLAGEAVNLSEIDDDTRTDFLSRVDAMGYRLGFEVGEPIPREPFIEQPSGIKPSVPKSAVSTGTTAENPTFRRLNLLVAPSQIELGGRTRVTLYGITADGLAQDITAQASFTVGGVADGSFDGNIFIPARLGNLTLTASYTDVQGTRTASAGLTVSKAVEQVSYSSLRIALQSSATTACSTRLPFKIYARYSNGTEKDVTIFATKSVSDARLLFVDSDSVLTYCAGQTSSADVFVSYTEAGLKRTASVTITVVPDPAAGGGYSPQPGTPSVPGTNLF